jgi:hypothetical protein
MSDRRLNALRRQFKSAWKERDRKGLVIEMRHAARAKGVMVSKDLFDNLIDAFCSRWLLGQSTFEIWCGVVTDFPQADQVDLEYASKFANRRIRESMNRGRKKKPRGCHAVSSTGGSAA